jgi:hypothetical protein
MPQTHQKRGTKLRHFGIDHLRSLVVGYRYTVVAVQDEVRISDLVEAHRREFLASVEGSVYALPPRPRARLRGHEGPIELPTSADAAHYLFHPYHLPSERKAIERAQRFADFLKTEQPIRGKVACAPRRRVDGRVG